MDVPAGTNAAKELFGKAHYRADGRRAYPNNGVFKPIQPVVQVSPETTPFLYSHKAVLSLIRDRRWSHGLYCPRCSARQVREVNSCKVVDAFNCSSCHYNFNSVSGTFFHGSKIGLHLQLRVVAAIDLLAETMRLRTISELTGISYKTAKLQYGRLETARPKAPYLLAPAGGPGAIDRAAGIMAVLERPEVTLNLMLFHQRLDELLFMPSREIELALAG